ncbi:Polycystic kidney disease protein 1-like 3 (PC1-like 3 protein) (Polycystin-1L3) [Durusdinium trenchii]|uniref:Polycystic kidney disease protein 1-like 3 (PC1-like 3 protein) (Polycystin-1L3) n=1 Tax=Durusdinium trenchii TaxID=1381693 RepID=A0ABP0I9Z9_9DINO
MKNVSTAALDSEDTQVYEASPIAAGLQKTSSVISLDDDSDTEPPTDDNLRRSLATEFSTVYNAGGHAMGDDWTDSQVPMDGYGPLQLHEPKEQGETESGANKALAQSEEAPQAGSSQAEKLPCGEAPSGHSTGILENPVVKEPDEVTKEELVPAHLEPKEVTKEELVPAHPEPKEVSNEEVVPAHSEPMEVTKEELVPADPEPKEVTKEEVVPAHPEPKEVTKEELVPEHLELEEVTKEEVVPAHLEPMEVTKEELVRAHPEPKEVTKEEVVPAHLEPEEVTKEEPIEPEAILVEEVGEGEGGGDKGPFKEEEVKEEPPLGKEEGDGEVAGAKGLKRKIETPNEVDEEKPEKQEKEHIKSFAEWWDSCMDALQNHAPADAKKGEIKCPALDFPKLVAEHAQVYLEETCLRMEPESP